MEIIVQARHRNGIIYQYHHIQTLSSVIALHHFLILLHQFPPIQVQSNNNHFFLVSIYINKKYINKNVIIFTLLKRFLIHIYYIKNITNKIKYFIINAPKRVTEVKKKFNYITNENEVILM